MRIVLDRCLNNIQKSRCEHNNDADRHGAVLGGTLMETTYIHDGTIMVAAVALKAVIQMLHILASPSQH